MQVETSLSLNDTQNPENLQKLSCLKSSCRKKNCYASYNLFYLSFSKESIYSHVIYQRINFTSKYFFFFEKILFSNKQMESFYSGSKNRLFFLIEKIYNPRLSSSCAYIYLVHKSRKNYTRESLFFVIKNFIQLNLFSCYVHIRHSK